ncbi:hypothetical protein SGPA1_12380 [Streptomyces misionensis JCM 4497]
MAAAGGAGHGRARPAGDRARRVPYRHPADRRRAAGRRGAALDAARGGHARRPLPVHRHQHLRRPRPGDRPAGADGPAATLAGDPVPEGHAALHGDQVRPPERRFAPSPEPGRTAARDTLARAERPDQRPSSRCGTEVTVPLR